jgi:predicted DNA-binding protein with PD1-like motif
LPVSVRGNRALGLSGTPREVVVRWKRAGGATYIVVLDPGDEAVAVLSAFAAEHQLTGAQITAVGAFERATVGWFDREAKDYRPVRVDQQCEVLSLVGDVALGAEGPQPHVHTVLGLPDGTTRGGHLLEGHVWPTLEVVIRETDAGLRKTYRPEIGLALIDLDQ